MPLLVIVFSRAVRFTLCSILPLLTAVRVQAQKFDSSGNASLNGSFFLRQVSCSGIGAAGTNSEARSLTGTITFNGAGGYSFIGQLMDLASNSPAPAAYSVIGAYALASNNMVEMTSPLDAGVTMKGALGVSALEASTPTGGGVDLLVAVPAAATPVSQSTLQGSYWVGVLDVLHGNSLLLRDAFFSIASAGGGTFGDAAVTGNAVNLGIAAISQIVSGATYSLNPDGSGMASFPVPSGTTVESRLISGNKTLYVSGDGNLFVAGAPDGYDLVVGIKTLSGTANNGSLQNVFFQAGVQVDLSPLRTGGAVNWSSDSGSFNATGAGLALWHQRLHTPGAPAYDYTFDFNYNLGSNGTVVETYYRYGVGAGGKAFLLTGNADNYALTLGIQAPSFSGAGVYLEPDGIVNAASFAPFTTSVAPGEFISLYGSNLAPSIAVADSVPYPKSLAGVSVSINGVPAPVYKVTPGRVDVIVPFDALDSANYATIQLTNNGTSSNPVTVYGNSTAPGIFTINAGGTGDGAVLHSDYSLVSSSNPAHRGEIVQIFLTGLGKTSPPTADGAPGPTSPLSVTPAGIIGVNVDGQPATVIYSGLAPLFPGIDQINVQIPQSAGSGDVYVDISAPGAYESQARIYIAP